MKTALPTKFRFALTFLAAVLSSASFAHSQEPEATTPTAPGMLLAFITAGTPDPAGKVPAINAIAGSGVANLTVGFPMTMLVHGKSYVYVAALQDNNYTGTYTITYSLTHVVAGKVVTLQSGTIVSNKTTAPGNVWAWEVTGPPIPNDPGVALLNAEVKYGTSTQIISTTVLLQ
jgi:hypothetical protein